MPETYAQKKARWQQQAATLPHNLGERISLRNVSLVAALEAVAQQTLAKSLDQGLPTRQVRRATRILKSEPAMSVSDLLTILGTDTPNRSISDTYEVELTHACLQTDTDSRSNMSASDTQVSELPNSSLHSDTLSALTDLLQTCFPEMGSAPADAMAKAPNMALIRELLSASQSCLADPASRSDIHIIVLAGLLQKLTHQIDALITTNPSYQRGLQNSGIRWNSPASHQIP